MPFTSRSMHQFPATDGDPPFTIAADRPQRSPIVLSIPHSGRDYPDAFISASRLDRQAIAHAHGKHMFTEVWGVDVISQL